MSEVLGKFGISETASKRILHLREIERSQNNKEDAMLRVLVYSGGCSGFKYHLEMTNTVEDGDVVISSEGKNLVVIDQITLDMIQGGMIDFVDEVSGSYFRIKNPSAKSSCGCGNSFS